MMNQEIAWRLDHVHLPSTSLDATYPHGRLGRNLPVVSRAVVAIGINGFGYCEVQGIVVGDSEAGDFAEVRGALPAQPAEPRAQ